MSQLPVSINGKVFNINCPDEEKENVLALAEYVNEKINIVAPKCKAMSESSLLSFTLLAIADDIFNRDKKIDKLEEDLIKVEETQKADMEAASERLEKIKASAPPLDDNEVLSEDVYAKIQMAIEDIKSMTHDLEAV